MKILIVASKVGNTAPGIVFERLINGLSTRHVIDVVTVQNPSTEYLKGVRNVFIIPIKISSVRLEKLVISIFGRSLKDALWSRGVRKLSFQKYDLVLSFVSSNNTHSLLAGNEISKKYKVKHFTYLVDAIPAPNGWLKLDAYYRGLEKLIRDYLSRVDGLFCANSKMLEYQLNLLNNHKIQVSDVILNPSMVSNLRSFENRKKDDSFSFLYTGSLYGLRSPISLLKAFVLLVKKYPKINLVFVGSSIDNFMHHFPNSLGKHIQSFPYTNNLEKFYENCDALIDIDADNENDVFLSSKIVNYLSIRKPIISITGENSPSSEIFRNSHSIFRATHDVTEIYNVMQEIYLNSSNINFDDRPDLLRNFYIEEIIDKFNFSFLVK